MILQALADYYHRKAADPDSEIAPPGFEWKEIPYVVVLSPEGDPINLLSTYEGSGKKKRAKRYLVPKAVKRSSGIASNLLWDNSEYAFGISSKGRVEGAKDRHEAFIRKVSELKVLNDQGLEAVRKFLKIPNKLEVLTRFEYWQELLESGAFLSFSLAGDPGLVLDRPDVRRAIERLSQEASNDPVGVCLISGESLPIQRLHDAIKGVLGAKSTGANIVSFNMDSFSSYGKEQGANAPIGQPYVFAYTTALNNLLGKDSRQRLQVGDATTVFWADKPTHLETDIVDIFGEPPKDDPDRCVNAVRSLFQSLQTGVLSLDSEENRFYVLGISPNGPRLSIRYWIVDTVPGMASKIVQHFVDLQIVHSPREKDVLSIFRLLVSLATHGKSENIPPNLAGETMRSILEGLPYPETLLEAAIRRIRAEHEITFARASLIKACVNRAMRFNNPEVKEELKVSLDVTNTNIGYRLGRLFAVLEKVQSEANPGINATIRDRFYGAASGTPVAVFSNLMRLKNHHLAKLENPGRRIFFEKLIAEIMESIEDFPSHLSLPDQGRFAIGYYHQNQSLYTSKKENASGDANNHTEGDISND